MDSPLPLTLQSELCVEQPQIDISAPAPPMHIEATGYVRITEPGEYALKIGADDNGSFTLAGHTVALTGRGPQGGGSFAYSDTVRLSLQPGYYKAAWSFDNIDYQPASGNVARFTALLNDEPIALYHVYGVAFIPPIQAPGGFNPESSTAMNYIEQNQGSLTPFVICCGFIAGDSRAPEQRLVAELIEGAGQIVPASAQADADGFAKFLVKTSSATPFVTVRVHNINSERHAVLPAVFKTPFRTTVYYTPRESGFDLKGPSVNVDVGREESIKVNLKFLEATQMEGWGKLAKSPVPELPYLGGVVDISAAPRGVLGAHPLGSKNNVLEDKISCAAAKTQFPFGSQIKVCNAAIVAAMGGNDRWTVADVGGGITVDELDLYWGEDDPSPNNSSCPNGLPNGLPQVPVIIELLSVPQQ